MRRQQYLVNIALVNRETTSTNSSILATDKVGKDLLTDLEARFRDFVACFDAKDSLGITVDSIEKRPAEW